METNDHKVSEIGVRGDKIDGWIKEINTVLEFHGDYWHRNPGRSTPMTGTILPSASLESSNSIVQSHTVVTDLPAPLLNLIAEYLESGNIESHPIDPKAYIVEETDIHDMVIAVIPDVRARFTGLLPLTETDKQTIEDTFSNHVMGMGRGPHDMDVLVCLSDFIKVPYVPRLYFLDDESPKVDNTYTWGLYDIHLSL